MFFFFFENSQKCLKCASFSDTEQVVRDLFCEKGLVLKYKDNDYVVDICAKPRPSSGECKTDMYLKLKSKSGLLADEILKISIKQTNADFLENKISLKRAREIFGGNAQTIISAAVNTIRNSITSDYLIYFCGYGRTRGHTIKLGWKFELTNKSNGEKSGLIPLSHQQMIDVYAGTNLSSGKKDSRVGGGVVADSGIAEYILLVSPKKQYSAQDLLDGLIPINEYVKDKKIYFACKALNYRYDDKKWDGDRPLAVQILWEVTSKNELFARFDFNHPLDPNQKGNKVGQRLLDCLEKLGVKKFDDLRTKLDSSVKFYG